MEFLIFIAVAVIAYYVGWYARGVALLMHISKNPDHIMEIAKRIKDIKDDAPSDATELKIERVGDTLYAYIKDTDQFVAQGPSLDNLLEQAKSLHPNRKFFGKIANNDPAKELV